MIRQKKKDFSSKDRVKKKKIIRKYIESKLSNPFVTFHRKHIISTTPSSPSPVSTISKDDVSKYDNTKVVQNAVSTALKVNPYLVPFNFTSLKKALNKFLSSKDISVNMVTPDKVDMDDYKNIYPVMMAIKEWFIESVQKVWFFWNLVRRYFESVPARYKYTVEKLCNEEEVFSCPGGGGFPFFKEGAAGTHILDTINGLLSFNRFVNIFEPLYKCNTNYKISKTTKNSCDIANRAKLKNIKNTSICGSLALLDLFGSCSNLAGIIGNCKFCSMMNQQERAQYMGRCCEESDYYSFENLFYCIKEFLNQSNLYPKRCANLKSNLSEFERFLKQWFKYAKYVYENKIVPAMVDICYFQCLCEDIGVKCKKNQQSSPQPISTLTPEVVAQMVFSILQNEYIETSNSLSKMFEEIKKLDEIMNPKCGISEDLKKSINTFLNNLPINIKGVSQEISVFNTKLRGCENSTPDTLCYIHPTTRLCVPGKRKPNCESISAMFKGRYGRIIGQQFLESAQKECEDEGCYFDREMNGKDLSKICVNVPCKSFTQNRCTDDKYCIWDTSTSQCLSLEEFCASLSLQSSRIDPEYFKSLNEKVEFIRREIFKFKEKIKQDFVSSGDNMFCKIAEMSKFFSFFDKTKVGKMGMSLEEFIKDVTVGLDKETRQKYEMLFKLYNISFYSDDLLKAGIALDPTITIPPLLKDKVSFTNIIEFLKYWITKDSTFAIEKENKYDYLYYLDYYLFLFYMKYKTGICSEGDRDFNAFIKRWLTARKDFQNLGVIMNERGSEIALSLKALAFGAVKDFFSTIFVQQKFDKAVEKYFENYLLDLNKVKEDYTLLFGQAQAEEDLKIVQKNKEYLERFFPSPQNLGEIKAILEDFFKNTGELKVFDTKEFDRSLESLGKMDKASLKSIFRALESQCSLAGNPVLNKCDRIEKIREISYWNDFLKDRLKDCNDISSCEICYQKSWGWCHDKYQYYASFQSSCWQCFNEPQKMEQCKNISNLIEQILYPVCFGDPPNTATIDSAYNNFLGAINNNLCAKKQKLYEDLTAEHCSSMKLSVDYSKRVNFSKLLKKVLGEETYKLFLGTLQKFMQNDSLLTKINCNEIID